MIKLSNAIFQDPNFGQGLAVIESFKLPQGTVLYSVAKLLRRLNTQFKLYREKYLALKKEHGVGQDMTDLPEGFLSALGALNAVEFELDCHAIDLKFFPGIKLTPAEYTALEAVLEITPEESKVII